jgi:hypothetical protein
MADALMTGDKGKWTILRPSTVSHGKVRMAYASMTELNKAFTRSKRIWLYDREIVA